MKQKRKCLKKYHSQYGTLSIFDDGFVEDQNYVVTVWAYQEFLNKCSARMSRSLLNTIYGCDTIESAIKIVETLNNRSKK